MSVLRRSGAPNPDAKRSAPSGRRALLPSTMVAGFFAAAIALGTLLLMLPFAYNGGVTSRAAWDDALFTATSAVTVTGLSVVDTGTHWTAFGQVIILLLIQLGGLGMATSGTILLLLVSRRLRLTTRLIAQAETPGVSLGDFRRVLRFALKFTIAVEVSLTVLLTLTFALRYGMSWSSAAWNGFFNTVSAFNNAGFSLFPNSLIDFRDDPIVLGIIMLAIIAGGLGVPVYLDIRHQLLKPRRWSLHSKLTVSTTILLIALGTVCIAWFEWTNPGTHAAHSTGSSLLNGLFGSVTARTAGFNSFDYAQATEETLLVTSFLMFIGGGSASTAGGIKVTTFVVLMLVVIAEAKGDRDVVAADRRIPSGIVRSALAVAVSYVFLVGLGTLLLLALSDLQLRDVLFEAVSAIGTVGLSTGATGEFRDPALFVLMFLMFTGRLGAMTLASAFALRAHRASYRLPKGQPIIG